MALDRDTVDVFLSSTDQRSSDHAVPLGRIDSMKECVATRFEEVTQNTPARYLVEPRKAFESLPLDVRDPSGAAIASATWDDHSVTASLDGQLIEVDGSNPRVYVDGSDSHWVQYPDAVQTNVLREDVLTGGYGSGHTPDHAIVDGVEAVCETQVTGDVATLLVGFRNLSGPWIVKPFAVKSIALTDGEIVGHFVAQAGRFWLIYNDDATDTLAVVAYSTAGVQLDSDSVSRPANTLSPGYWDVTACVGDSEKVLIVQPAAYDPDSHVDVHVDITSALFDEDTNQIVLSTATHTEIACNGQVTWLTNGSAPDVHDYLGTRSRGGEGELYLNVYQLDSDQVVTDSWSVEGPPLVIDAFSGFIPEFDAGSTYAYLVVGYCELESATGPRWNPQRRVIITYRIDMATDVWTQDRISWEQALATRPFSVHDVWQTANFYQSGQGYATQTPITPALDGSTDYFYGSALIKLPVAPGDQVRGSPITVSSSKSIGVSGAGGSAGITGADTVAAISASGVTGVPDGTPLLEWTFANLSLSGQAYGSFLTPVASSISAANHGWFVVQQVSTHVFRTLATSLTGFTVGGGTFGATGTVSIIASAIYDFSDLQSVIPLALRSYYINGTLTVTGNDTGGNNVTDAPIYAVTFAGQIPNVDGNLDAIYVPLTTQAFSFSGFSATITPAVPNVWLLAGATTSTAMIGGSLNVTGDTVNDSNNGTFEVTDVLGTTIETANETTLITEIFDSLTLPDIYFGLGSDQIQYAFHVASLSAELAVNAQRLIGATLAFTSSVYQGNTGQYRIIGFDPALDGTIYTERVVSSDDQLSQTLVDGDDSVVIYPSVASMAPFQPTYFLTPALGTRATVGCFDRLSAYNDWRQDGVNTLHGHLSRPVNYDGDWLFVLNTRQQPVNIVTGPQVVSSNTVGVKLWTVKQESGQPVGHLLPGTMATSFEKDAFPEDGFQLAPEAPWFLGQTTADPDQLALTKKTKYVYQFLFEAIDQQGNRVFSPPSPPLQVQLTGDNNQVTLGGCLPTYWNTDPIDVPGACGWTNRTQLAVTVVRTSLRNGTTTVTRYRLTNNLTPNQLAPVSDDNPSGFTFNGVTFEYIDQNADDVIQGNDTLYAGYPRFGAPAFSRGCTWQGRDWLLAPDGALYFSTAETEGVRKSYNQAFRIAPPVDDRPVAVVPLERYLTVLCEQSVYWLPVTQLPNSLGQGTIPQLVKTKFTNGCNGPAISTGAGVVYASTAGGLWLVTEDLQNVFFSKDVRYFDSNPCLALAVNSDQRLVCAAEDGTLVVYDFVSRLWSLWTPAADMIDVTTHVGATVARSAGLVSLQTDGHADLFGASVLPIAPDVTLKGVAFGGVRKFARLRKVQATGEYRGPHYLNASCAYPDDYPASPTTYAPKLITGDDLPYLYEFTPLHGKSSSFDVRFWASFDGIETPGESFALEVLSCEVGLDQGAKAVPSRKRL